MKSTQNEKISQIKITTLVVGIDVAKNYVSSLSISMPLFCGFSLMVIGDGS